MYDNLLKYTDPSWNEVLTEQGRQLPCSENSRIEKMRKILVNKFPFQTNYVKFMDLQKLYETEYILENYNNPRLLNKIEKIKKWGHPKKCHAINQMNNIIIF